MMKDRKKNPEKEVRPVMYLRAEPEKRDSFTVRLEPFFHPRLFPGLFPELKVVLEVGQPKVEVGLNVEAKVVKLVTLKRKIGLAYSGKDNSLAFMNEREAKIALSEKMKGGEMTGELQLFGAQVDQKREAGAELAMNFGVVSTGVGLNSKGDLSIKGGVGLSGAPEPLKKVFELKGEVAAQVSAPVVIREIQYGSQYGLDQISARIALRISEMMASSVPCPYCSARGEISCKRCGDRRKITCPTCHGSRQVNCSRCSGSGRLSCSTTQSCGNCGGSGKLRCSSCSGSGRTYYWDKETRSRQKLVIDSVGFDSRGNPIYNRHYVTEYYDAPVQKSTSCNGCSGTGRSGSCGSCGGSGKVSCRRCGGAGWVSCGSCDGRGKVSCYGCSGSGAITCPNCYGSSILCGLCQGKKRIGKETPPQAKRPVRTGSIHQGPEKLKDVARGMVQSGKYGFLPDGKTQCKFFVRDFGRKLFSYRGFENLRANGMVDAIRANPKEWKGLYDPVRNNFSSLQQGLNQAQDYANKGYFVVVGWKDPSAHPTGHVAVVLPGQMEKSSTWGMMVPQIAQAGTRVFSGEKLSEGFGSDKKNQMVIYVRKP